MRCKHCNQEITEENKSDIDDVCCDCLDALYVVCEHCSEWVKATDTVTTDDNKEICNECRINDYRVCQHCDNWVLDENTTDTADGFVCDDCLDNHYVQCAHCEEYVRTDRSETAENRQGSSDYYCSNCADNHTFVCEHCGDRLCDDVENYITDSGDTICDSCYNRAYFTCSGCGEIFHQDDEYEDGYCESCADSDESPGNSPIHRYHFKPRLHFRGKQGVRKMGFELEVEGNRDEARYILDQWSDGEKLFWLENDASINSGFELITHPATLEVHKNDSPWKEVTEYMLKNKFKSHDTTTCGLHIHVSKAQLTPMDQVKIGLFCGFNATHLSILGRREYNHYCYKKEIVKGELKAAQFSKTRYDAVNFSNRHTIEFRFFKGTLKYETIIASLEFVDALCAFVKTHTFPVLGKSCWIEFVDFVRGEKEYKQLYAYMIHRSLVPCQQEALAA